MSRFDKKTAGQWDMNIIIQEISKDFSSNLINKISLDSTMKIIDFGGGTGLVSQDIIDKVEVVTIIDSSNDMLQSAKEKFSNNSNVRYFNSTSIDENVEDNSIDGIITHMALHHVEDIEVLFSNFKRVLKADGFIAIGDLYSEDGSFHGGSQMPHNGFNTDYLVLKLEAIGFSKFEVEEILPVNKPNKKGEVIRYGRFILIAKL